ncbi:hypothetical protein BV898_16165 [Hypsibius exemplaris]|uniref:Uncharacterized protein n=1 Tax=Hypsibius exemplaris TaxID=2072580 RepID=A0A9X6NCQ6_HYPEX|nr:hypothetical protein BV898_16165 [Hypsibius exemplaris]
MSFHVSTAVSDLVTRLNALTYDNNKPTEVLLSSSHTSLNPKEEKVNDDKNVENSVSTQAHRRIDPGITPKFEDFHVVPVDPRNIVPALDYYGHPGVSPPFPTPVRWMVWSEAQKPPEEFPDANDSEASFGDPDLTTLAGIKATAERTKRMLQEKHKVLYEQLQREVEREGIERQLNETLLRALDNAKNQSMMALGDMIRHNEQLELRLKDLAVRQKELETETVAKVLRADSHADETIKSIEKVIKDKDETILKLASEIKFLRTFAEEKDQVQASIAALRGAARDRYHQQQLELNHIHDMQMEEQHKLQGLAADRLLALTEQSYDSVLHNLDDSMVGVFYRNCQVQDAVAIWLQRNKDLKKEKRLLNVKIQHVMERRKPAANYLSRYGVRQEQMNKKIREYQKRCDELKEMYKKGVESFEQDCREVVPAVQKQLKKKTSKLRTLERDKAVKRAELQRTKQLLAIVNQERSSMEKGLIWGIRSVMERTGRSDVDDLSWSEREMILRRVFVYMNLIRCKPEEQMLADFEQDVESYVGNLEKNLAGIPPLAPRLPPSKLASSTVSSTKYPAISTTKRPLSMAASAQRLPVIAEQPSHESLPSFGFQKSCNTMQLDDPHHNGPP